MNTYLTSSSTSNTSSSRLFEKCIYLHLGTYTCIYISLSLHIYIYTYGYIYIHMDMYYNAYFKCIMYYYYQQLDEFVKKRARHGCSKVNPGDISIYLYSYLYLSIYLSIYIYIYIYIYLYLYMNMYLTSSSTNSSNTSSSRLFEGCLYLSLGTYIYVCTSLFLSLYIYVYTCIDIHIQMYYNAYVKCIILTSSSTNSSKTSSSQLFEDVYTCIWA